METLSSIFKKPKAVTGSIDKRIGSQKGLVQRAKMKNDFAKNRFKRGNLFKLPDGSARVKRMDGGER